MVCNHIFVFTTTPALLAEEFLSHGFIEGPNRIHPGQGTQNRKFYFDNFYIEVLWMYNEDEIRSSITAPVHLWERASYTTTGYSPFGMCLDNHETNDKLFERSLQYKPIYLPEGMAIEVLPNLIEPYLPWTFRWPTRSEKHNAPFLDDQNKNRLTEITFGITAPIKNETFSDSFKESPIHFVTSKQHFVTLTFDEGKQKKRIVFKAAPIILEF